MILARSSTPLLLAAALAAGCTSDSTDMLDRNGESSTTRSPSSAGDGDAPAPGLVLAAYDGARAHWVAPDLDRRPGRSWPGRPSRWSTPPDGGMAIQDGALVGGTAIELAVDGAGLPADVAAKFPHLAAYRALRLPKGVDAAAVLRGAARRGRRRRRRRGERDRRADAGRPRRALRVRRRARRHLRRRPRGRLPPVGADRARASPSTSTPPTGPRSRPRR